MDSDVFEALLGYSLLFVGMGAMYCLYLLLRLVFPAAATSDQMHLRRPLESNVDGTLMSGGIDCRGRAYGNTYEPERDDLSRSDPVRWDGS